MGSCCSKRDRRSDSTVHAGVLHPSLENWKIHNRHPLSELNVGGIGVDRNPVLWAKPTIKPPPLGFPSILHSNHLSSRSFGTHIHAKPRSPQISSCTSKPIFNEDCLQGLVNQHISSHHHHVGLISATAHHSSPTHEPANEAASAAATATAFSFATPPHVEPDFLSDTPFSFHPANRSPCVSSVTINSIDGIKLQVRHKHMFPEEFQASQASLVCSMPSHQEPSILKRSRSDGKLPDAKQADGEHTQRHRSSFHEKIAVYDVRDQIKGSMADPANARIGGESLDGSIAQTSLMDGDYTDDEDDNDFLDINVGVSIDRNHADMCRTHTNVEQVIKGGDIKDIRHVQVSSESKNFSAYDILEDFEFKHSACGASPEIADFMWDHHEKKQLSMVATGDAILLSGSDLDEFHLIPSRYVPHPHSPPPSPTVNLTPLKLSSSLQDQTCLSVHDIMLLLECDDINEDDLLSLLICNTKSSPSRSPSPSSSMSTSSTSLLTSSSTSSLSSSSTSSSSSSPRPWFPCPSTPSSSPPLLSSMPLMSPFSTRAAPSSTYSLSQRPSSRRISPHSSFEFKVKSCNSAASTPMFSPIRSTTKRNIAHLKPTALTTEEIAEIWGVFEQRQSLVPQH